MLIVMGSAGFSGVSAGSLVPEASSSDAESSVFPPQAARLSVIARASARAKNFFM